MSSPIRTTKRSAPSRTTKLVLVMPPRSGTASTGLLQQGRDSARRLASEGDDRASFMPAIAPRLPLLGKHPRASCANDVGICGVLPDALSVPLAPNPPGLHER